MNTHTREYEEAVLGQLPKDSCLIYAPQPASTDDVWLQLFRFVPSRSRSKPNMPSETTNAMGRTNARKSSFYGGRTTLCQYSLEGFLPQSLHKPELRPATAVRDHILPHRIVNTSRIMHGPFWAQAVHPNSEASVGGLVLGRSEM